MITLGYIKYTLTNDHIRLYKVHTDLLQVTDK
jgi:hypothetical protein